MTQYGGIVELAAASAVAPEVGAELYKVPSQDQYYFINADGTKVYIGTAPGNNPVTTVKVGEITAYDLNQGTLSFTFTGAKPAGKMAVAVFTECTESFVGSENIETVATTLVSATAGTQSPGTDGVKTSTGFILDSGTQIDHQSSDEAQNITVAITLSGANPEDYTYGVIQVFIQYVDFPTLPTT